jgi:hypothetical protein
VSELIEYDLDLMARQEVRWVEGVISPVKRVEFIIDRMLYITLRGPWYDFIGLNVHVPTENKSHDTKDSFYEELERVLDQFPKTS